MFCHLGLATLVVETCDLSILLLMIGTIITFIIIITITIMGDCCYYFDDNYYHYELSLTAQDSHTSRMICFRRARSRSVPVFVAVCCNSRKSERDDVVLLSTLTSRIPCSAVP